MEDQSVVVIGLPASGKTTFLAALWHLVTARDVATVLRFRDLRDGDVTYLNTIAARWRNAQVQDRTAVTGSRVVSMNLLNAAEAPVRVTFPDLPGEAYLRMWEDRECEHDVADVLRSSGVLLFVHADEITAPSWTVDEVAMCRRLGINPPIAGEAIQWHPRLAPTQVTLVDLLQSLRRPPLDLGPRHLAIMLSAWDKASEEGLTPSEYLQAKMPLLWQYLGQNVDGWTWRIYGLSAQGGDYDPLEIDPEIGPNSEAEMLRDLDSPSTRIRLVDQAAQEGHDLTEPLAWLMS